jgi:hypothetical protein
MRKLPAAGLNPLLTNVSRPHHPDFRLFMSKTCSLTHIRAARMCVTPCRHSASPAIRQTLGFFYVADIMAFIIFSSRLPKPEDYCIDQVCLLQICVPKIGVGFFVPMHIRIP